MSIGASGSQAIYGQWALRGAAMAESEANRSIEDMIELMAAELERMHAVLETLRLARASKDLIRWQIDRIDERESELERLRRLIAH